MVFIYNIVLFLFFIPVLLMAVIRYRTRLKTEFFDRWQERLGSWNKDDGNGRPLLWVHCASLGEVRAVEPLIRELSGFRFLITTVTRTGRDYAQKAGIAAIVRYAPLDFSLLVRRALRAVRPAALLVVETELWPSLLSEAKRNGMKVIVVNGRMSRQSYPVYRSLRPFWKKVLSNIDCVIARAKEDAERFAGVGFPRERIVISGNIKYDREFLLPEVTRAACHLSDEDVLWVCGSTREGEEELLFDAFKELRKVHPHLKLVVAPRHLTRVGEVTGAARRSGLRYARFTEHKTADDLLVVDVFGELLKFYALSDIAFVGGSLVDKGGQNPIEPAAYARPVLFGRHMDNFLTEAATLEETGGGFRVVSTAELVSVVGRLLSDPVLRKDAGTKAYAAVQRQKGAVHRTAEILHRQIGQKP